MKCAVVTGGTGFIGSWLVEELVKHQIKVIMLVRPNSSISTWENVDLVQLIQYDSKECEALKNNRSQIDVFFHLAWGGVSSVDKNDCALQMENIEFSIKMLEYASDIGAKKFIGTGTVAEYAFCEDVMDVNARQTPNDMYGAAKTAAHYLLETRARILKMPFIWAVIPSTYGEGRKDNNILTYTICSLLREEIPEYGYLTQMWDFLYVGEVARALYLIGELGKTEKTYGIGSGIYKPLRTYVEEIRNIINPNLEIGIGKKPEMSERAFSSCVNIEELIKDTGFFPSYPFEKYIKQTIQYYSKMVEKV